MTNSAQNALRRVIEKFTENTRLCIICNYLAEQMLPRLEIVIQEERVNITEDGKKAVLTLANGDMRRSLNVLQSTHMAYDNVDEDKVYTCVGHPLRKDIENIVNWILNEHFTTTYINIIQLKMAKGLALQYVLTEVHKYVHRIDLPLNVRIHLLEKLADCEYRLSAGASEKIQLSSMIAAFQIPRDLIIEAAKN